MIPQPVVVIGAGLAGFRCARHLREQNIDVVVLEAQDVIVGRVRTDRVDGFLLDHRWHPAIEFRRSGRQCGSSTGGMVRFSGRLMVAAEALRYSLSVTLSASPCSGW